MFEDMRHDHGIKAGRGDGARRQQVAQGLGVQAGHAAGGRLPCARQLYRFIAGDRQARLQDLRQFARGAANFENMGGIAHEWRDEAALGSEAFGAGAQPAHGIGGIGLIWLGKAKAMKTGAAIAKAAGGRVSLFMDADASLMPLAQQIGADRVELYTEPYAAAFASGQYCSVLNDFAKAAQAAAEVGLGVNAGHDLNLFNLTPFLKACPQVQEVSIGHAFMADALEQGYQNTVQAYLIAIQKAFA